LARLSGGQAGWNEHNEILENESALSQMWGVVYARSLRNCGFCGVELPLDFAFSEAEKAAIKAEEEERIKTAYKIKEPEFPFVVLSCYLICSFICAWLAVHEQRQMDRWIHWGLAAVWMWVVVERMVRFYRQKKKFERQSRVG
jgi:hypothetical protein